MVAVDCVPGRSVSGCEGATSRPYGSVLRRPLLLIGTVLERARRSARRDAATERRPRNARGRGSLHRPHAARELCPNRRCAVALMTGHNRTLGCRDGVNDVHCRFHPRVLRWPRPTPIATGRWTTTKRPGAQTETQGPRQERPPHAVKPRAHTREVAPVSALADHRPLREHHDRSHDQR